MYKLGLSPQELDIIAKMLQEWPYRIVKPVLDNIAKQIDEQNKDKDLTSNQD